MLLGVIKSFFVKVCFKVLPETLECVDELSESRVRKRVPNSWSSCPVGEGTKNKVSVGDL